MGKFIDINAREVKPSQNFIKERTIGYILKCILSNEEDKLPPTPIIRNNPDGDGYVAIDGHNLIVIYDLLDIDFNAYLAESATDELTELPRSTEDAIIERNRDLFNKFDQVIEDLTNLREEGISSFEDLRTNYPYLNSLESAKQHYNLD